MKKYHFCDGDYKSVNSKEKKVITKKGSYAY